MTECSFYVVGIPYGGQGVYASLPGSASGDEGQVSEEDAVSGEGRAAVAALLRRMLCAAKHDTVRYVL